MQTSEAFHIIPLSYRWGKCTLTKSVMGTGAARDLGPREEKNIIKGPTT